MRKVFLLVWLFLLACHVWAQDLSSHQFSSSPNTSRFEIVQSERGARYTFKINKYNGEVFQLVKSLDEKLVWESLGIDPVADLFYEIVLEVIASLPPGRSAELLKMSPEQITNLNPEQMTKFGLEKGWNSVLSNNAVNFQLFISGLGARYTFLLHVHSGKTWQLVTDPETDLLFWSSID